MELGYEQLVKAFKQNIVPKNVARFLDLTTKPSSLITTTLCRLGMNQSICKMAENTTITQQAQIL